MSGKGRLPYASLPLDHDSPKSTESDTLPRPFSKGNVPPSNIRMSEVRTSSEETVWGKVESPGPESRSLVYSSLAFNSHDEDSSLARTSAGRGGAWGFRGHGPSTRKGSGGDSWS